MRTFLSAAAFLTRLPAPRDPVPAGRAAIFFPLAGAMLGAVGAGIYLIAAPSVAAILTVGFWTVISRGRIGTVGMVLSVIARWFALEHTAHVVEACIASQTVARAGMVALAWVSRPSGTELTYSTLSTPAALVAMAQGIAAAFLCGLRPGIAILGGAYLIIRLARWYSYRRIGSVNSAGLNSTEQLLEVLVLVLS